MYSSNRSCIYDKRFLLKWGLSSANSHATLVVMITQTLWQVEGEARSSFNVAKFIAEAYFCHPEMAIILLGWIIGSLNPKNVRDPLRNNNGNTTTFRRTIYNDISSITIFLINLQPKKTYSTKLSITCIPKKFWIILQQISNRKKKRRKIDLVEKQEYPRETRITPIPPFSSIKQTTPSPLRFLRNPVTRDQDRWIIGVKQKIRWARSACRERAITRFR